MTIGLSLHTHGEVSGAAGVALLKVIGPNESGTSDLPPSDCVMLTDEGDLRQLEVDKYGNNVRVTNLRDGSVVAIGDVIRVRGSSATVSVVWRRTAKSNALFATERCDSACLMCSQPPREIDDSWRVAELVRIAGLMDKEAALLTITGGEPTLLGFGLVEVLRAVRERSPATEIQVLTNGRAFRDAASAAMWVEAGGAVTRWAIPLYSDLADRHDHIIQSAGGFEETMAGLFVLATLDARVELRVVLHKLSVPRLRGLATLIYRRLPFVEHIALMGLEPMGFAKANRDSLWVDPADYGPELGDATHYLANRGLQVSIYNLPRCVLPKALWPYARQSISEWKNNFSAECGLCVEKPDCAGFFRSAGPDWRSRRIAPILALGEQHEMA